MIDIKIAKSNKCNGDYSMYISFPYDNALVELIRSQSERYWDKNNKTWEVPATKLRELLPYFTKHEVNITGDFSAFNEVKKVANVPAEFQFKTKPYDHQIDGLNFGLTHDKWLLGDEQGLGKTKQVIDIAVAKKLEGANRCLIICGVNGLKWNWQNEIKTHSNESGWILGQRKRRNGKIYIGSTKDKLEDLKNLNNINDYFLITNVESLRDADIATTISNYCKKGIISMVAVDEIHKCLDYNSEVLTDRGYMKIGDIVTNELNVNVVSYNEQTKNFEFKPVVDWHEKVVTDKMITLTIQRDNGEIVTLTCTPDHKIHTRNRGWVEAQKLSEFDDITS